MRLTAIFPVLCTMIALILAFLCVFAGSKVGMLESYDIVTLNTSRIAVDLFNTTEPAPSHNSTSGNDSGFLGSLVHNVTSDLQNVTLVQNITSEIQNLTASVENKIETALNDFLQSVARDLGLHDFYSVHVLDFCEGFYEHNSTSSKNVTYCSKNSGAYNFNLTQILQRELNASGIALTLHDLHWPSAIENGLHDLKQAFNATFVIYCIGIAFTGLAFIAAVLGVFTQGRMSALINMILDSLAFLFLLIASAIVTYAGTKATNVINKHGHSIDVNASRGGKFLALTWTAVALTFVAVIAWSVECVLGRQQVKKIPKQYR